jgi:drug/metabolite transporter (DMT)-like permease
VELEAHVAAAVLLCAAAHASWNALVKGSRDPLLALATVIVVAALCLAPVAAVLGLPPSRAWPWLAASVPLHGGYHLLLWQAYRSGDLSVVYPIARGCVPPLVAVLAAWLVGEWLRPKQLWGLGVSSASIASLALWGRARRWGAPVALALGCGALTAGYSLVDGQGARAVGALHFVAWSHLLDVGPIAVIVWIYRRGQISSYLAAEGIRAAAGGALGAASYAAVLWAMTRAPLAQVSMLRETSVVFGALLGARVLREPLGAPRTLAAVGLCAGVALLLGS